MLDNPPENVTDDDRAIVKPVVEIRNATVADVPGIIELVRKTYPEIDSYTASELRGQMHAFPGGQFVVAYDGAVIGYAATFVIAEQIAFGDHTWESITGNGYAARHDPQGDWLYGMEVCVDPQRRRLRIGHRLYEARKGLCQELGLKGIVFGGRIPGFAKRRKQFTTPEAYLEALVERQIKDPTAGFQMRAGFEPVRILRHYNRDDTQSGGHAILMRWDNPFYEVQSEQSNSFRRQPSEARVTTVQLQAHNIASRDEFYETVDGFAKAAGEYASDFVVFPELFTLALLSAEHRRYPPDQAIQVLSTFTDEFVERLNAMAMRYNVNIIGGSHPTRADDGDIQNISYVFLRDGSVHVQEKLHPTPDERYWWNIRGGDAIETIETDCGPIGVLICYDSEFPELARKLVDEGALILFVPFCTDTRQGYLRVRYCCQARAVENQCYVVTSGNVGNLPDVENMDLQYAQSAIFTPCDFPFARDGIAAETSENIEMVAVADLDLGKLHWARQQGAVRNLQDRRFDLYRTVWE